MMLDPVARAIAGAEIDDEPENAEERLAVAEATEWLKSNKPIAFEPLPADFGAKKIGFTEQARADVLVLDIPTAMRILPPCSGLPKLAPSMSRR